jgi:hypothetical protein
MTTREVCPGNLGVRQLAAPEVTGWVSGSASVETITEHLRSAVFANIRITVNKKSRAFIRDGRPALGHRGLRGFGQHRSREAVVTPFQDVSYPKFSFEIATMQRRG